MCAASGGGAPAVLSHASQEPITVHAVDVLHREERLAIVTLARTDHLDHVLVLHERVQQRLAFEHPSGFFVEQEVGQQPLDDHSPLLRRRVCQARKVNLRGSTHGQSRL